MYQKIIRLSNEKKEQCINQSILVSIFNKFDTNTFCGVTYHLPIFVCFADYFRNGELTCSQSKIEKRDLYKKHIIYGSILNSKEKVKL